MRKNANGYTLLEMIIVIVILSIVSIPISLMMTGFVNSIVYSGSMPQACGIANMELDAIKKISDYTTINSVGLKQYPDSSSAFDLKRTVTPVGSTKKVVIEVFPHGSSNKLTGISTIIANAKFGPALFPFVDNFTNPANALNTDYWIRDSGPYTVSAGRLKFYNYGVPGPSFTFYSNPKFDLTGDFTMELTLYNYSAPISYFNIMLSYGGSPTRYSYAQLMPTGNRISFFGYNGSQFYCGYNRPIPERRVKDGAKLGFRVKTFGGQKKVQYYFKNPNGAEIRPLYNGTDWIPSSTWNTNPALLIIYQPYTYNPKRRPMKIYTMKVDIDYIKIGKS